MTVLNQQHTWVSLRQASSRRHHHILSLRVSMRVCVCVSEELHFSRCNLFPVCFSVQPRRKQPHTHTHAHSLSLSLSLSLKGKQSLYSQGCAIKCLSFLSIQRLLPMTLPPSPLHLGEGRRRGKTILAMNKVGDLLLY